MNNSTIAFLLLALTLATTVLAQDCSGSETELTAGGGSWDSELSWSLNECDETVIVSGEAGSFCVDVPTDYFVVLFDTFGDGWNGAMLEVNGASYSLDNGIEGYFGPCAPAGDTYGISMCTRVYIGSE